MVFESIFAKFLRSNDAMPTARGASIEVLENRRLLSASLSTAIIPEPPIHPIVPITAIQPIGVTIHAEAGEAFSGVIGKVKGFSKDEMQNLAGLKVVVNWGDTVATTGTGTLSADATGVVTVSGHHTYVAKGDYKITVVIETRPPVVNPPTAMIAPLILATIHSSAQVAADNEGGVHLVETATQKFSATLGTFDFANVDLMLTAVIHWGDGTTSAGTIERTGTDFDDWKVVGTHTYQTTGEKKVHIDITGRPIGTPGGATPDFIIDLASINSVIDVKGHA